MVATQDLSIKSTQYLLCGISMMLTGLFALSFAPAFSISTSVHYLPHVLMVLVGIGVDLSKFLFWQARKQHVAFNIMAISLVVFSCAASVAFFLGQERASVEKVRATTAIFKAHQEDIALLSREIQSKQNLLEKRLSSQFHNQWDKGAVLAMELSDLRDELTAKIRQSQDMGRDEARQTVSTSAFFSNIAEISGASLQLVMTLSYGVLALLIEICALGMMAISSSSERRGQLPPQDVPGVIPDTIAQRIKRDILQGVTPPVARRLITTYRIRHALARDILVDLADKGNLRRQGKSYVLCESRI